MPDAKFVKVREHLRRMNQMRKGTGGNILEIQEIAPQKGEKIIDTHAERVTRATGGVTRLGGGDHGKIEKGVKRLGR